MILTFEWGTRIETPNAIWDSPSIEDRQVGHTGNLFPDGVSVEVGYSTEPYNAASFCLGYWVLLEVCTIQGFKFGQEAVLGWIAPKAPVPVLMSSVLSIIEA